MIGTFYIKTLDFNFSILAISIIPALDNAIKSKMVRRPDGSFGFTDCDYVAKYNTTCQNHIESKHLLK